MQPMVYVDTVLQTQWLTMNLLHLLDHVIRKTQTKKKKKKDPDNLRDAMAAMSKNYFLDDIEEKSCLMSNVTGT